MEVILVPSTMNLMFLSTLEYIRFLPFKADSFPSDTPVDKPLDVTTFSATNVVDVIGSKKSTSVKLSTSFELKFSGLTIRFPTVKNGDQ